MKLPLHILHLEPSPHEAGEVVSKLQAAGLNCSANRVGTQEEFVRALREDPVDLILSEVALPGFDGMTALEMARKRHPGIPFIFLSNSTIEEFAVESLKSGATDFVLKRWPVRLAPAIRRAVQDAEARQDRARLEEQFLEAQKMEVIGHLAGGVAHDFNNILAVILGYTDLTTLLLEPDSRAQQNLEEIRRAAERAAALARQLLAFGRKQSCQPVVLDLNEVLTGLDKMLRRLIDEHIMLVVEPGRETGRIKADSGHVGQVLMNLVVNARDAMPQGGVLTVKTANASVNGAPAGRPPSAAPGEYVVLTVNDNGTGMSEEVRARLFEAFFTTKPRDKGTGLGLATCQRIIGQCGGFIDVRSEPGKGSTFDVYFPRVYEQAAATGRRAPARTLPKGTETLLLVEDDPAVRHLAADVLEMQGYRVLRASNGQEGLRVAGEAIGHGIDLVITDVVMPRMSGKVMAEWLKATYPDMKVLFTSGYAEEAVADFGVFAAGMDFLAKPYTPSALAWKVRAILDEEETTA
jgi:signal transduction histidine kinase